MDVLQSSKSAINETLTHLTTFMKKKIKVD